MTKVVQSLDDSHADAFFSLSTTPNFQRSYAKVFVGGDDLA